MSTIRLKTNHRGLGSAGDVVSVPFGKGKELVGIGAAEYLHPAAAPPAPTGAAAEKIVAELEAENARLRAENAELKELLAGEPAADKGGEKKPARK